MAGRITYATSSQNTGSIERDSVEVIFRGVKPYQNISNTTS
jgi:hypothetical protein